jgi:hypothetical protein
MKIALIAHDGKKADMVSFVMKRLPFFQREDVAIVNPFSPLPQPLRTKKNIYL